MGHCKKNNLPKISPDFSSTQKPRIAGAPPDYGNKQISWHVGQMDFDGGWGFNSLTSDILKELHSKMKSFETMTWDEILRANGARGKKGGNNNHSIPCEKLCKDAQERLSALQLDDVDELFSLHLTGTHRLWGIRQGLYFRILWYDHDHSVCPISKD